MTNAVPFINMTFFRVLTVSYLSLFLAWSRYLVNIYCVNGCLVIGNRKQEPVRGTEGQKRLSKGKYT